MHYECELAVAISRKPAHGNVRAADAMRTSRLHLSQRLRDPRLPGNWYPQSARQESRYRYRARPVAGGPEDVSPTHTTLALRNAG